MCIFTSIIFQNSQSLFYDFCICLLPLILKTPHFYFIFLFSFTFLGSRKIFTFAFSFAQFPKINNFHSLTLIPKNPRPSKIFPYVPRPQTPTNPFQITKMTPLCTRSFSFQITTEHPLLIHKRGA